MLSEAGPSSQIDAAGLDSETPASKTISLTPEQMEALSLGDPKPGQIINIQLEYGSSPPAAGSMPDGDSDSPATEPDAPKLFTVISSTTETQEEGPADEDALPGNDDESPEQKTLGFKRAIKPARQGLPPASAMRDM